MREENLGRIALTHSSTMWHGHKLKIYGRKRQGDIRYNYHTEECYILESWRSFYCLKKTENHQGDNDLCLHFGSTSTIRDLPLSELQIWTMHTPNSMRIHGVPSRMFNVLVTGKTRRAKMMSGLPKSQLCIGGGGGSHWVPTRLINRQIPGCKKARVPVPYPLVNTPVPDVYF